MTVIASILWRRLNTPGQDACRLERRAQGWRLAGMAVFQHQAGPAGFNYAVECSREWMTLRGEVRGFLGDRRAEFVITREDGNWTMNGTPVPEVRHLVDLDLGFTPATNLIPLRRSAFRQGEVLELPAAWLDIDAGTLTELPQTYERRSETAFWYRSPSAGYEGVLQVSPEGFVRSYPDLWEEEPPA